MEALLAGEALASALPAGDPVTRGRAAPVDKAAPETGGVKEHFFLLRVGLGDELASGTTASPSRRGCKLEMPFESIESAEAEWMVKNDRASRAKECVHEETFMLETLLERKTHALSDSESNISVKEACGKPLILSPYTETSRPLGILAQFHNKNRYPVSFAARKRYGLCSDALWSAS